MVFIATLEEWQKQSALLLQARPSTTRVLTKYTIPNLSSPKYSKPSTKTKDAEKKEEERTPRATLELKTFDTASGVALKFKTDRAADVGRLIAGLGTLGRHMAALPEKAESKDIVMDGTDAADTSASTSKPQTQTSKSQQQPQQQPQSSNAGKKKKKGKK